MIRRIPSSPTIGPSGVVNVVPSALARKSRTFAAFRASGHATVVPWRKPGSVSRDRTKGGGRGECRLTGVIQRLPRFPVPQEGRLALRRNSDSLELIARVSRRLELLEAGGDTLVNLDRVDCRVVFMPARLRVDCRGERNGVSLLEPTGLWVKMERE